jgi:peptidoglycan/xylan/chitin deacetylase (PgdA/CDA1 family)
LRRANHCGQLRLERNGPVIRPAVALVLAALPVSALAAPCANPDALGTARVLTVDAAATPRVGRKEFAATLPLGPKELVLTFDDGPWPTTTPAVLKALADQCVLATFFVLGRNVAAHPELARREEAEGHSIGHHTFSHHLLDRMAPAAAWEQVVKGVRADEQALHGTPRSQATTPFFRFPGFASTPALLDRAQAAGLVVFGADVWASDWRSQTPDEELALLLKRIDKVDHGIVLLHDTRAQTARMLPALLRALKAGGYRIVHVVATGPSRPLE